MSKTATSTVSVRWQTAIPAVIREELEIQPQMKLTWLVDGDMIYLRPVPKDPIKALRGITRGEHLVDVLLRERVRERELERKEESIWQKSISSTPRRSSLIRKKKRG